VPRRLRPPASAPAEDLAAGFAAIREELGVPGRFPDDVLAEASWACEALPRLPEAMAAASRRAGALERACVDLVEAELLRDRVGERFRATVVELAHWGRSGGTVTIPTPAVCARCDCDGRALGAVVDARLAEADPAAPRVRFPV
jgi:exoribonuclease R